MNNGNSINTSKNYPLPNLMATPAEKKENSYGLAYAKAMYGRYLNADYSIYNRIAQFVENRKYAEGMPSIEKFKDQLDLNGDASYLNLDFQSVSVIPKFVNLLVGEMINQEFEIQAEAMDEGSMAKYDEEKAAIYANLLLKDFSAQLEEMTGFGLTDQSKPVPKDKEEADILIDTTLKQAVEIAMEVAIKFVNNSNNYDTEIKERIIRDLVVIKIAATRRYFDEAKNIKTRYVDPANLIIPYTKDPYMRDRGYGAEIVKMGFNEFVQLTNGQFNNEEILEIGNKVGKQTVGSNFNLREENGRYYNSSYNGSYTSDDFYITVVDFEFRSNNFDLTYEKKYKSEDKYFLNQKTTGYQPSKHAKGKREVFSKNMQVMYEGLWVVGTDYVANYGLAENMTRPKKGGAYSNEVHSRYEIVAPGIYDMTNKSIVESMIPHDDQIELSHLKLQQAMIKARPSGVAVDAGALEDVLHGRGEEFLDPMEIVEIFDQTGNMYYRSESPEFGGAYNQQPIRELANGLSANALNFVAIYNHELEMIRQITGINEARDGSTPSSKALPGAQKLAVNMSRNATRFLNEAYLNIFKRTAEGIGSMIQLKAMGDGLKGFELALGKEIVDVINVVKDLSFAELGINIVPLPDAEERAYLESLIEKAITVGSIELEDAMEIRDVSRVNVKKATHLLKKTRKDKAEQAQKAAEANAQAQSQAQGQQAQQLEQMKMQTKQMEHQQAMELQADKYNREMELAKVNGMMKGEVEMIKGDEKKEQIKAAMDANLDDSEGSGVPQPKIFSGIKNTENID
jgi:hypothetical protein